MPIHTPVHLSMHTCNHVCTQRQDKDKEADHWRIASAIYDLEKQPATRDEATTFFLIYDPEKQPATHDGATFRVNTPMYNVYAHGRYIIIHTQGLDAIICTVASIVNPQ